MGKESVSVLNADDARVAGFAKSCARAHRYIWCEWSPIFAPNIFQDRGLAGTEFSILLAASLARALSLPLSRATQYFKRAWEPCGGERLGSWRAEAREVFPKLEITGMRGRVLQ